MTTHESQKLWRVTYTDQARKALLALESADQETLQTAIDRVAASDPYRFGTPSTYSVERRSTMFGHMSVSFWITVPGMILTVVDVSSCAGPRGSRAVQPSNEAEQIVLARTPGGSGPS